MPAKKKGPSRHKNFNKNDQIPWAEDNGDQGATEYAKITRTLGDCRFTCLVQDGEHCGHLSGRVKKRGRVNPGDIVLVSRRDFESCTRDEKLDILWKYNEDTARILLKSGDLDFTKTSENTDIDSTFVFQADGDEEINFDDI